MAPTLSDVTLLPPPDQAGTLTGAVQQLLLEESGRNEARVGLVRVFAYSLVAVLDVILWAVGVRPFWMVLRALPFVVVAALLLLLIRRAFRPWVPFVTPIVDGVCLAMLINGRLSELGPAPATLCTGAVACGLFAATGGIRFNPRSAQWTTTLAVLTFVASVGWRIPHWQSLYTVVAIAAIGLLSWWQAGIARRALEGERGRTVLKRFLHGELVDQAFSDPFGIALAPREVRATLLVSDLRGFTTLSEKLTPVEVLEFLNEVQTELAAAVKRHGGVVDKFLGDGMLATFGALRECPNHPKAAIRCATEIVKRVERINQAHPQRKIQVGVGVHTGVVVAGTLGHGDRMEFTVLGDPVNTASRLEGVTKELGIAVAISGETAREVSLPMKPCGEVALRGRAQPVQVFTPVPRASRSSG